MASERNDELAYADLNRELIERFSALRPAYESLRQMWEGEEPGPHIVYGDVLTPHLISVLEGERSDLLLPMVFEFLELLANSSEPKVQEVAAVTVLERLNDNKEWRERARQFMGPRTLQLSHEIEQAWGS